MLFELATLACPLLAVAEVATRALVWVEEGEGGTLLGCWRTELGTLGRVIVFRGFDQPEDMTAERRRALLSSDPFRGGRDVAALEMESYAAFPFLPDVRTGARGGIYEFRTYILKRGGLAPTLSAWEQAIGPAHDYTAHLIINMYALDGPPRITHIWGFDSLEQRANLRGQAYSAGLWPPKGGPDQIATATATIALPVAGSPLT